MFFRVFNIKPMENKESVKYKTKKINMCWNVFFLKTKNQISAKIMSSRNLRVIATRLCIVWLSGSLVWPRRNMNTVISAINEKTNDKIAISPRLKFTRSDFTATYPDNKTTILITARIRLLLTIIFPFTVSL